MALFILLSNFKWKLIFGLFALSHVITSSHHFIIVAIVKATPPFLPLEPSSQEKFVKKKSIRLIGPSETFGLQSSHGKNLW
jgi:hypothetical protein